MREELIRAARDTVQGKLGYFTHFGEIANAGHEVFGRKLRQYKTEKWLQAEIAVNLRERHYDVGTEVPCGGCRCDIAISCRMGEEKAYLALKCFTWSGQSPHGDGKGLIEDIHWAFAEGQLNRVALAVLPTLESGYTHKAGYRQRILQFVQEACPAEPYPIFLAEVADAPLVVWWMRTV